MKKRIVIIGGGFTGSYCARKLEKIKNLEVTLIDTKDYFEFTPGILRTIINPEHEKKIIALHKNYLHNTRIILGEIKKINDKSVYTKNGKFEFDYLIISSGSEYKSHIKEENVILPNRLKILKDSHSKLDEAKRILIIGGGLVGVELAAEITEKYPRKNLTLVHPHERLIQRNSPKSGNYYFNFLKKRSVKINLNEKTENTKGFDLTFFCTGIKPNLDFMNKKLLNEKGIIVNKFLQIKGKKHIFAGGDVTNIPEEKTAQNAENHAKIIVKNILNQEKNKFLETYEPKSRVMIISLGKNNGILEYKKFILTGKIPALLKSFVEWKTMRRYR